MSTRNFSDYLPPALIKDLRQTWRSPIFLAIYFILPLFCLVVTESRETALTVSAPLMLMLVIPMRAAQSVSADTRIRGTNFMKLTPLSSRSIVRGIWLSVAVQILLTALLLAAIFMTSSTMGESFVETSYFQSEGALKSLSESTDYTKGAWYAQYLLICSMGGLVTTAFFMFTACVAPFFRYCIYGGFLIAAISYAAAMSQIHFRFPLLDAEIYVLGGIDVALLVLLFLELARRGYAPPAENCSRSVRLLSLAPLAVFVAMWLSASAPTYAEAQLVFALGYMGFAAVADILLPCWSLPVHRSRCLPLLPRVLQVPGLFPSCLFLVLAMLIGSLCTWLYVEHPVPDSIWGQSKGVISVLKHWNLPLLIILDFSMMLLYSLLATVLLLDLFMRRGNPNRPVVFLLLCYALMCVAGVLGCPYGLPFGGLLSSIVPSGDTVHRLAEILSSPIDLGGGFSSSWSPQTGVASALLKAAEVNRLLDAWRSEIMERLVVYALLSLLVLVGTALRPRFSRN